MSLLINAIDPPKQIVIQNTNFKAKQNAKKREKKIKFVSLMSKCYFSLLFQIDFFVAELVFNNAMQSKYLWVIAEWGKKSKPVKIKQKKENKCKQNLSHSSSFSFHRLHTRQFESQKWIILFE